MSMAEHALGRNHKLIVKCTKALGIVRFESVRKKSCASKGLKMYRI